MSVNPGFGGQNFLPAALDKIRRLRAEIVRARARRCAIEVDGGIDVTQHPRRGRGRARSVVVAGNAVFGRPDPEAAARRLLRGGRRLSWSRPPPCACATPRPTRWASPSTAEYFAWFEVGRTDLLRERGCTYRELEADGLRLPVIERRRRYLRPARLRRRARGPHARSRR